MATFRYYHLEWWLLPIEDMCDALLPAVLWCEMMEKNIEYSSMGGKKVKQKIRSHRQTWMCDMHAWLSVQVSVCAVCLLEEREENIHSFCWNLVEIPKVFFFDLFVPCTIVWFMLIAELTQFPNQCFCQCAVCSVEVYSVQGVNNWAGGFLDFIRLYETLDILLLTSRDSHRLLRFQRLFETFQDIFKAGGGLCVLGSVPTVFLGPSPDTAPTLASFSALAPAPSPAQNKSGKRLWRLIKSEKSQDQLFTPWQCACRAK